MQGSSSVQKGRSSVKYVCRQKSPSKPVDIDSYNTPNISQSGLAHSETLV